MHFNKFYQNIRNTPEYDDLMEHKETEPEFKDLTSKGFMAIFYINDLMDQRYKMHQIVKLFPIEYIPTIKEVFQSRLKFSRDKRERKRFVWDKLQNWVKVVDRYNSTFVKDAEYFQEYYPSKKFAPSVERSVWD